jgi:FkbH-like protein
VNNILSYPLDINNILRKNKSIKNELIKNDEYLKLNIAILGGSTTHLIKLILELFLLHNRILPNFYESEYNQYYEDALFGDKTINLFEPDLIYIHTSNVNISVYPKIPHKEDDIKLLIKNEVDKYKSIWSALSKYNCAIIQNNFDYPYDRSLGNLDCYDIHGKTYFINQLNYFFSENARNIKHLYINDINYLSSYIGISKWFDKSLWYRAKYALSMDSIPELCFNLSKIIKSIFGGSKKCLVLDLDNTCWGGIIGDDGLNGIDIGSETAIGEAFTAFQTYVKELMERGVTLAVCSKNELRSAKEGFEHPDSILKLVDFTSFKANWEPKYKNLIEISKEINIGLDSLVFMDDNPVERDSISNQTPNVCVPNIGNDILQYIDHLDRNCYFEPISLLEDDINRNKYYAANKQRDEDLSSIESFSDFLESLNMCAEIKIYDPIYLDRIAQLTNKTNQFNLTTKRYSNIGIERLSKRDDYIIIYGKLTDKYGDNGLVAITIGRFMDHQCHLELWLMSCRVINRDLEYAMLDELVKYCINKNITELIGYYYKTKKNNLVADLYERFGFDKIDENNSNTVWSLKLNKYHFKNTIIKVING